MVIARSLHLAGTPAGLPQTEDFVVRDISLDAPEGGALAETLYVSVDPAMRTWISGEATYRAPVMPGEPMPALGIGRIIASNVAALPIGALVRGPLGVATHAALPVAQLERLPDDAAQTPHHLGMLGIAGLSAWFGLTDIGRIRAGDRVIVSGAAGAVGSAVGQIARLAGASRVIGVAGGLGKCDWARDTFGFDSVLDYRADNFAESMMEALPAGADIVFDNVGGPFLELALDHLALGARVVVCGGLSQYNQAGRVGPANYLNLVVRRASMAGFLVHDFARHFPSATARLLDWYQRGQFVGAVDIRSGIESFPCALAGLFAGINRGKLLIAPNPELIP